MSSSAPSTSKPAEPEKVIDQKSETQPHLGVLEEDDEFEEFPAAGMSVRSTTDYGTCSTWSNRIEWDEKQTYAGQLGTAAPGSAKSGADKLWEDNWDDDDVEEEFSVQLRCVYLMTTYSTLNAYILTGLRSVNVRLQWNTEHCRLSIQCNPCFSA